MAIEHEMDRLEVGVRRLMQEKAVSSLARMAHGTTKPGLLASTEVRFTLPDQNGSRGHDNAFRLLASVLY